jgi:hypothetical protein
MPLGIFFFVFFVHFVVNYSALTELSKLFYEQVAEFDAAVVALQP